MTPKECRWRGEERRWMYPWTLKEILRQFKHPNIATLGIMVNRWGEQARAEIGLKPHGTIFYAAKNGEDKRFEGSIPQNYIPCQSIHTAKRDPDQNLWKGGDLMRGWRPLLHDLVKAGLLRSCQETTWLIGQESKKVQGRTSHSPPRKWAEPTGVRWSIYP